MVICSSDALKKSSKKKEMIMKKEIVEVLQQPSYLCVKNRCMKVTSKLILPSVSRCKFCPHYKSRVKKFVCNISQLKQGRLIRRNDLVFLL